MTRSVIFTAPNGVGVAIDSTFYGESRPVLRVLSPCCGDDIHWDMERSKSTTLWWYCSKCREIVTTTPADWASICDIDLTERRRWSHAEWFAMWFDVSPDRVTVVIEP